MRLLRAEAVRYGRLEGARLGDLGGTLTVVIGPNEAGKSTFTSLVRHVLYGFPTRGMKEPGYFSDTGGRLGRLIFSDEDGELWTIERSEGPHGGSVAARSASGQRDELLGEITRGVSAAAYRTVFGFGLAELAQIDEMRGTDDDIVSVLNPVLAGLGVDPVQVRVSLDREADAIHAPRASTRRVNELATRMAAKRKRLRELEDEASAFAVDQASLAALEPRVEAARRERDETSLRDRSLDAAVREVTAATAEIARITDEIHERELRVRTLRERVERLQPDERVLEAGPSIDALLADLSAHRDRMERLRQAAGALAQMDRGVAAGAASAGIGDLAAIDATPEVVTGVGSWRDRLADARTRAEASARASEDAAAASRAAPGASRASSLVRHYVPVAAVAILGIAVVAMAWGARQSGSAAVLSAILVIAVIVFLLTAPRPPSGAAPEERSEAARIAAERAQADERIHHALRAEWIEWRDAHRLEGAGDDPAAVAALLDVARGLHAMAAERDARSAEMETERQAAQDYAQRLADAVRPFLADADAVSAETAPVFAERAREALTESRDTARERDTAARELEALDAERRGLEERLERARESASDATSAASSEGRTLVELEEAAARAAQDASAAALEYEALAEQRAGLDARLGTEARTSEMGVLRLELGGLEERLNAEASDYAVLAAASRLLSRTQELYEREHQPDVVRAAESVFRDMTRGRFDRLSVPLGGGGIEAYTPAGEAFDTARLSRGTAEALYLALRIGLISTLGATGASLPVLMDDILANLDPERREGAADAIARLSESRQVVFFTCHPGTVEKLSAACPGLTILALDRCPA